MDSLTPLSSSLHWQVSDIGLVVAGYGFAWLLGTLGKVIRYAFAVMDSPDVPPSVESD
jgi:hypothetical protein